MTTSVVPGALPPRGGNTGAIVRLLLGSRLRDLGRQGVVAHSADKLAPLADHKKCGSNIQRRRSAHEAM